MHPLYMLHSRFGRRQAAQHQMGQEAEQQVRQEAESRAVDRAGEGDWSGSQVGCRLILA